MHSSTRIQTLHAHTARSMHMHDTLVSHADTGFSHQMLTYEERLVLIFQQNIFPHRSAIFEGNTSHGDIISIQSQHCRTIQSIQDASHAMLLTPS